MPVVPIATGVWPKTSVRDVAESLGLSNVSDQALTALAWDVEFRLNQIIEESIKFMRHSKRTTLLVEDVDYALRAKNIEPLWGFASTDTLSFRRTTSAAGNLYFVDDTEIDLTKILSVQLPPVPREVSYTAHWLAVEGVQPAIPQNPSLTELKSHPAFSPLDSSPPAVSSQPAKESPHPSTQQHLSRELRLYFDRVTTAAYSDDPGLRNAALASLSADPGLHQLVPYLVQFAAEKVTGILTQPQPSLSQLRDTVIILESILSNPHSYLEPYLHQILPCILTCLLFVVSSSSAAASQLEREIRISSASLLSAQLARYQQSYPTLRTRILKTLTRSLVSISGSEGSRLGGIIGLKFLGREATKVVLGQNVKALGDCLESDMANGKIDEEAAGQIIEESLTTMFSLYDLDSAGPKGKKTLPAIPAQDELENEVGTLFAAKLMATSENQSTKLAYAFIKEAMTLAGEGTEGDDGGESDEERKSEVAGPSDVEEIPNPDQPDDDMKIDSIDVIIDGGPTGEAAATEKQDVTKVDEPKDPGAEASEDPPVSSS